MKISVITPSIRKEGLIVVARALAKQTFRDFEWLVGCPFPPEIPEEYVDNIPSFMWVKDNFKGGYWSLNRIYNKLFKKAKGEIIVSLQDCIWVPSDGLQKFVDGFASVGDAIISGVGDQYEHEGEYGKPEIKIWSDPRKNTNHGTFYECYPNDVEWNWCAFPKKFIYDIGGMDEALDFLGFGGDQLQVGERWDAVGYKSYLDQGNESYTIRHDRSYFGGLEEWDSHHVLFNGEYEKRKWDLVTTGQWPKLKYLV